MDTDEHFHADDQSVGPPDVRTDLPGVSYPFVGDGWVQAAVQVDPSGTCGCAATGCTWACARPGGARSRRSW